jgi:hypothetical protein
MGGDATRLRPCEAGIEPGPFRRKGSAQEAEWQWLELLSVRSARNETRQQRGSKSFAVILLLVMSEVPRADGGNNVERASSRHDGGCP